MTLRGIDISGWQPDIDVSAVDADFVIVKASGGNGFVNPYFRKQADAVLAAGKLLGVYHFAQERGYHGSPSDEAAHFVSTIRDYIGKAIPVLDWEADALAQPVSWAREWMDAVAQSTGSTPWFYGYASNVNSTDYSDIAHYPLWMACYHSQNGGGGHVDNPYCGWATGAFGGMVCYQYTSDGYLSGYGSRLDLNVFYGSREDWNSYIGGAPGKRIELGKQVAAQIHRNMCDDGRFGYSWAERYGGPETTTWNIEGHDYTLNVGDYDCSSSTITAWRKALEGTPYEGALDDATYTGNMRSVFVNSGLFDWVDVSQAQPGDLYLNEGSHVAMCQPDGLLSEFSMSETGGIYGERGDQTGWESHITGYYNYPWDGCLKYNGKADPYTGTEVDDLQEVNNNGGDVYRVFNPNNGLHHYTISKSERDQLVKLGWKDEGVAFTAPKGGTVAVYRMYNPNAGQHLFTASFNEAKLVQSVGWRYEGVPFFGAESGKPIHRAYNPGSGEHLYTASKSECDQLSKHGWTYEGIAWYV